MHKPIEKNVFFDINKLPAEKGLLIFALSMSKLANRQNPENCVKDVRIFSPSKISKPLVGLNFIYSDYLYLYSDKSAPELKESFMHQVINHKNGVQRILQKNHLDFQIQHAFNYMVWNQLYVGTNDFNHLFEKLKKTYREDSIFQKYVSEDCRTFSKGMEENQVNFFLEETLMFYLLMKNQIKLPNEYIQENQKWILLCYPGRPMKSSVYLYQLNPLKLDWPENPYQNAWYDLGAKQLIEFDRVDLETYKVR
jgi:hypothetical protein